MMMPRIAPTSIVSRISRFMRQGVLPNEQAFNKFRSERIEAVLSLESIGHSCYQSLQEKVRNGQARRQCVVFCKEIVDTHLQLKHFFHSHFVSWQDMEQLHEQCKKDHQGLSAIGLVETALPKAVKKIEIYRSLLQGCHEPHVEVFQQGVTRSLRENRFLRNEKDIQHLKCQKVRFVYFQWVVDIDGQSGV